MNPGEAQNRLSAPPIPRRAQRGWHVLAPIALLAVLAGAACDGKTQPVGLSAGDAGTDAAEYTSAPPPLRPQGGDDTSDVPLSVDDTTVDAVVGTRLYHLSAARGLLVFDVTDVDHPALVGSAAMTGTPQALYVTGNVVVAVLGDGYETTTQSPFHGSVVRALDCTDPAHPALLGDVEVQGEVQASRLQGGVLITGSTDQGLAYGRFWGAGAGAGVASASPQAVVTSIAVGSGAPRLTGSVTVPGDQATFAFGPAALAVSAMLPSGGSTVQYVDLSDPSGAPKLRGSTTAVGTIGHPSGYCANGGAVDLDFADGVHARAVSTQQSGVTALETFDFSNPDAPVAPPVTPLLGGTTEGLGPVARFDVQPATGRALLYFGAAGAQDATATTLAVYDVSTPTAPRLAGTATYAGSACTLLPTAGGLLTLASSIASDNSIRLDVRQIDVPTPSAPQQIGAATVQGDFPISDALTALAQNAAGTLATVPVILNPPTGSYTYGLEVLTLGSPTLAPSGLAATSGQVQRALFVQDRVYAVAEDSITVFDVSQPSTPKQTGKVAFTAYAWAAVPLEGSVAELSSTSDMSSTTTDVRLVPTATSGEASAWAAAPSAQVPGGFAQAFASGSLLYVSTSGCGDAACKSTTQYISVVDTSGSSPRVRGSISLPTFVSNDAFGADSSQYGWFTGPAAVLASPHALAVRLADPPGPLYVVDLSNPDAPVAHAVTLPGSGPWWGNLRELGGTLYATTLQTPADCLQAGTQQADECANASYSLVPIDVSDPTNPRAGSPISVPGVAFGSSTNDPSIVFLVDYQWGKEQPDGELETASITTCRLATGRCTLVGTVVLGGLPGLPFVQGEVATVSIVPSGYATGAPHQIDLTEAAAPVDHALPTGFNVWGMLLAVSGDTAVIESGWPGMEDVYRLGALGSSPTYVGTIGSPAFGGTVARQGSTIFVTEGLAGVQAVTAP